MSVDLATVDSAKAIASRMRKADRDEVMRSHGLSPIGGVLDSMRLPGAHYTVSFGGVPAFMFGVVTDGGRSAILWLLGTDSCPAKPVLFWRVCKAFRDVLLEYFDTLGNAIDAQYTASLRWAARLGCEVAPAAPLGPARLPFNFATLRRR